jgi:hypothetical protein
VSSYLPIVRGEGWGLHRAPFSLDWTTNSNELLRVQVHQRCKTNAKRQKNLKWDGISERHGIPLLLEKVEAGRRCEGMSKRTKHKVTVAKINLYIQTLCGIYSRVARRLGVDRSYVSRVAKGERTSPAIEDALISDFKQVQESQN